MKHKEKWKKLENNLELQIQSHKKEESNDGYNWARIKCEDILSSMLEMIDFENKSKTDEDYAVLWNELKEEIANDMLFHETGEVQSINESVQCEAKCREILTIMADIENQALSL